MAVICLASGLVTCAIAVRRVLEFLVIVKVHSTAGRVANVQGAEFPFLWLIVIMLRGRGPISLDARLGKEI